MQRRQFTGALGAIMAMAGFSAYAQKSLGPSGTGSDVTARLKALERESGGRLGVSILDTGNGARWGYRAGERPSCCIA